MNPILLLMAGALWFSFFGVLFLAYLESKLKQWGVVIVALLIVAFVATMALILFSNGGGTQVVN